MMRAMLATALLATASASVSFMPNDGAPGGYYFFTVAKLYNFDPTLSTSRLEMTLPNGLWMAVPEDHPGWQPTVTQRTVEPYMMHGRMTTSEPGKIVWQAAPGHQLAAGSHAQFGLQLKIGCNFQNGEFHAKPEELPRLYFPTVEVLSNLTLGDGMGDDKIVENKAVPDPSEAAGGHHTMGLARNIELSEWSNCPDSKLSWLGDEVVSPVAPTMMDETQVRSLAAAEVEVFNQEITAEVNTQDDLAEKTTLLVAQAAGKITELELLLTSGMNHAHGTDALTSDDTLFVATAVFSFFGTFAFLLAAILRCAAPGVFRSVFVPVV